MQKFYWEISNLKMWPSKWCSFTFVEDEMCFVFSQTLKTSRQCGFRVLFKFWNELSIANHQYLWANNVLHILREIFWMCLPYPHSHRVIVGWPKIIIRISNDIPKFYTGCHVSSVPCTQRLVTTADARNGWLITVHTLFKCNYLSLFSFAGLGFAYNFWVANCQHLTPLLTQETQTKMLSVKLVIWCVKDVHRNGNLTLVLWGEYTGHECEALVLSLLLTWTNCWTVELPVILEAMNPM